MGAVIISRPGQAVAIPTPNDAPMPLAISGWGGSSAFKSIITEIQVSQKDKFQAVHSLDELVYVYSFGRELGQLRIGGVAFNSGCDDSGITGLEHVQNYYDTYCASNQPNALTVAMGTSAAGRHSGFLVGMDTQIARPEARLSMFGLQFLVLPRRRG
jgi:hypothetical protein